MFVCMYLCVFLNGGNLGKKYAANHWIHLNDYEGPNRWGCTGSFS